MTTTTEAITPVKGGRMNTLQSVQQTLTDISGIARGMGREFAELAAFAALKRPPRSVAAEQERLAAELARIRDRLLRLSAEVSPRMADSLSDELPYLLPETREPYDPGRRKVPAS
jgi:hypothetical protein